MQNGSDKPIVFISYSQKDEVWLDYVRSFFEVLADQCELQLWHDKLITLGSDWRDELNAALAACRIFIVLVSRYSLTSKFVQEEEIPRIMQRPKQEVRLCPIVVTPCYSRKLEWLDEKGRRPRGDKALSELLDAARDREMAEITEQIDQILLEFSIAPASPRPGIAKKARQGPRKTTRMAPRRGEPAPIRRAAFPSIVDYGRMPEGRQGELVGRGAELARLDDAWNDSKAAIISLVAWGGAGKTSIVTEWVSRLRRDRFRGADAVLAWSFYSQGTDTERAASGEGFLDWALGKLKIEIDATSSTIKGERLAEEFARRRVLLMLDGLEPLQFGAEGQQGALKDLGLRAFLRALAQNPAKAGHSLVVATSRLAIDDLRRWQGTTAPLIDVGRLSNEAGAALLRHRNVEGSSDALQRAVEDFGGHALALSLLAGYLRHLRRGDVNGLIHIRAAKHASGDAHDQAGRIIEALEAEWLVREPVLLAIMHMIGLFDRPASADSIAALRREPVIAGFNDAIVGLGDEAWRSAIAQLREMRLLDPEDAAAPDALDAHPLVREWFGDRLRRTNEPAWKAAHGRLFDHLRNSAKVESQPKLEDLAPLYQAITHGCRAGRYEEALEEVYIERICRRRRNGEFEFYSTFKLGAYASDLAAISWFFEKTYDSPVKELVPPARAWLISTAGNCLLAQGRATEALAAQHTGLRIEEAVGRLTNVAITKANIATAQLLVGQIDAAVVTAGEAAADAANSGSIPQTLLCRATLANALQTSGLPKGAERLFIETEQLHKQVQPQFPLLYGTQGYYFCDWSLANGDYKETSQRALKILGWANKSGYLGDIALATLALGRASFGLALLALQGDRGSRRNRASNTEHTINEAVERLHNTGSGGLIPRGLLARAAFHRSIGDWKRAVLDLDEVDEIAKPGPMKLYLCDRALEHARLAFARTEGFAPLNGLLKDSMPKPIAPDAEGARQLKQEAAKHLAIAADYIETCGYHRRDEELAELQAVLRGERKFPDLPPRV